MSAGCCSPSMASKPLAELTMAAILSVSFEGFAVPDRRAEKERERERKKRRSRRSGERERERGFTWGIGKAYNKKGRR